MKVQAMKMFLLNNKEIFFQVMILVIVYPFLLLIIVYIIVGCYGYF